MAVARCITSFFEATLGFAFFTFATQLENTEPLFTIFSTCRWIDSNGQLVQYPGLKVWNISWTSLRKMIAILVTTNHSIFKHVHPSFHERFILPVEKLALLAERFGPFLSLVGRAVESCSGCGTVHSGCVLKSWVVVVLFGSCALFCNCWVGLFVGSICHVVRDGVRGLVLGVFRSKPS